MAVSSSRLFPQGEARTNQNPAALLRPKNCATGFLTTRLTGALDLTLTIASTVPTSATSRADSPHTHSQADPAEAGGEAAALGTSAVTFSSRRRRRSKRRRVSAREAARRAVQRSLWALQKTMWKVTKIKRLAGCHRWRRGYSGGGSSVVASGVLVSKRGRSSRFVGLQDSHSVWGSPVAAAAISLRRIKETTTAVENFLAGDNARSVAVLTLTLPHRRDMRLAPLLDVLADAHAALFRRVWRQRYGVAHYRKGVEVTHGTANGFHPHEHVLLFLDRELSAEELDALKLEVHEAWASLAVRHGANHGLRLDAPSWEYGVDIQQADDIDDARALAVYAAKANMETWTVAAEVAGGAFKRAKGSNRTLWQVLEDLGKGRENNRHHARDLAIWLEYEESTHGRRQSSWSQGAVAALGVDVLDDEDIDAGAMVLEDEPADEERGLVEITPEGWDGRLAGDIDKQLELKTEVAAAADNAAALDVAMDLLRGWGVGFTVVDLALPPAGGHRAWRTDVAASRAVLVG